MRHWHRGLATGVAGLMMAGTLGVGAASPVQATGNGPGNGQGNGTGSGPGSGDEGSIVGLASGTLTASQRTRLAAMADEEKLALDVYRALAAKFPSSPVFARIAKSEERHLDLVRQLLRRYRIADPTADKPAGQYGLARTRALYLKLMGSASTTSAAYAAGRAIERDDLAELGKAGVGVTAPDVKAVYKTLTTGSQRHLKAFNG